MHHTLFALFTGSSANLTQRRGLGVHCLAPFDGNQIHFNRPHHNVALTVLSTNPPRCLLRPTRFRNARRGPRRHLRYRNALSITKNGTTTTATTRDDASSTGDKEGQGFEYVFESDG